MGRMVPLEIYYNRISSSNGLWDDVFRLSPAYSMTYTFAPKRRSQWYLKHLAFMEVSRVQRNSREYLDYFIRIGGGQMYYLPFAPYLQWQWELGLQADRSWTRNYYSSTDNDPYFEWRLPLPYAGINLQTTAIGKHLIAGVGIEASPYIDIESFVAAVRFQTMLAWSLKARDQNPNYEKPSLGDHEKRIHIMYQLARYGSRDYYAEKFLTDMRSIVGEYWWGYKKQWRLASRLGLGFGATGKGDDIGIDYDWLVHVEQNAYLRLGEHFPILPFGGVGILTGQVWQESYAINRRINTRKNLFRPYLKGGLRVQAPHHRIFVEFSANTVPSFQMGVGLRFGS